jgi:hypothetical protein
MSIPAPDKGPTTNPAQIAAVTIYVTCECGEAFCHEIECEEDDFGGWSAAPEDRFILCETCDRLIDAGLQVSIGAPA